MPIVFLGSAHNLTELAEQLFDLSADDPRLTSAVRALSAANPRLPGDLSALSPKTRIIVPSTPDLPAPPATRMPQEFALVNVAGLVANAIKQLAPSAPSEPTATQDANRLADLQRLAQSLPVTNVTAAAQPQIDATKRAAQLQQLADAAAALVKQYGG